MTTTNKPSTLFWVVAVILLLWNFMGAAAFITDNFFTELLSESYSEIQIAYVRDTPLWAKIMYGIATLGGLLAAILLIARKTAAVKVYLVSLLAVIIHTIYQVGISDATEIFETFEGLVFPLIIVVLAIFEYWFSKYSNSKGWLS